MTSLRRASLWCRAAATAWAAAFALSASASASAQERVVPDSLPERPRVPAWEPGGPIFEKTLKNGVRLVVQEQRTQGLVAGCVSARMGTRFERAEESGLGHVLLRTMLAGTSKSSASDFHVRLRGNSASLDGGVGADVGQFVVRADRQHALGAASLLADIVLYPSLPDTAFEAARVQAVENASYAYDSPLPQAYGVFLKTMFAGTPYQRHLQGTVASISQARRSDLVDLHRRVVVGGNLTVAFVGNFDGKKMLSHLEKLFEAAPAGGPLEPTGPEPRPLAADTTVVESRPWQAHAYVFGYPAPGYLDPDYPAFAILDSHLRSEDRSPLLYWMQVREDAVSPGILFTLFPARGSIAVYFGATSEKLEAARDTTVAVMRRLREVPLERGEWSIQIIRVQNGFMFNQNEPETRARNISRWVCQGLPIDYGRLFEEAILKLKPEDVRAAAERWFTHSCEVRLGPPLPAAGDDGP